MIIIHHSKDMDGHASGAICKFKYPNAKLIGWDYSDDTLDFDQLKGEEIIMIDITFPLDKILVLGNLSKLTVIDHHISFKKQVDELKLGVINFTYIYEDRVAACEIGWKYLFPNKEVPYGITLIGRYDTWRQEEGNWENETLPFKYFMYGNCNSADTFPIWYLEKDKWSDKDIIEAIKMGKSIMGYQETMDESIAKKNTFIVKAYGLNALAINYFPFSSETLKSLDYKGNYDIMVGFCYTGNKWGVSLRSIGNKIDCSAIAKARGGGGHFNAAGFEVNDFNNIFI